MFNRIPWTLPTRRTLVVLAVLAAIVVTIAAPDRHAGLDRSGASSGKRASAQRDVPRPVVDTARDSRSSSATPTGELDAVGSTATSAAAPDMAVAPGGGGASASAASGAGSPAASPGVSISTHVIQTGDLTIEVRRGELEDAFGRASRVASALGGYVVSSQTNDGPSRGTATLTMRVPNAKFAGAVDRLADIGKVRSRQVSGEDVSAEYVDTRSRLRHTRAVEGRLMLLLRRAATVQETLVVQDRLDQVQQQLEIDAGRLQYLDSLTELATIDVTVRERGAAEPSGHGSRSWGVHDAFAQAARGFVDTVNDAVVWIGSALPLLLALSIGGLVLWRRSRTR